MYIDKEAFVFSLCIEMYTCVNTILIENENNESNNRIDDIRLADANITLYIYKTQRHVFLMLSLKTFGRTRPFSFLSS